MLYYVLAVSVNVVVFAYLTQDVLAPIFKEAVDIFHQIVQMF